MSPLSKVPALSPSAPNAFGQEESGLRPSVQQKREGGLKHKDENRLRGNWSLKADYMLSAIGFTVGLGNLWRFPYLVYKNGGGAFLIPYAIMMTFTGIPMVFLESALGQFSSLGPLEAWKVVPILQGLGIVSFSMAIIQATYYNAIIAYGLYYLFASFQFPLPWADCSSLWGPNKTCAALEQAEILCNVSMSSGGYIIIRNKTCENRIIPKSSSEIYWDEKVLHRSSSINYTGRLLMNLVLCLLLAWILIFIAVARGIKKLGKFAYFAVTYPYVGLILLLIRGATLDGAHKGVQFYFGGQSDITRLGDIEVWKDALTQTFLSQSVAVGGLMSLSSYNKFHNDCFSDCIIISFIDCLSSIFAGFGIFTVLGHLAHNIKLPISRVTHSGFGLAFIACPYAIFHLPFSSFWSIIFFSTIITLGLTSEAVLVEIIITSLQDEFPKLFRKKRVHVSLVVCVVLFFCGLLFGTQAGIYWINLLDYFCSGWGMPIIALLELIAINWIYGVNNFIKDIEMMCGVKSIFFWYWWRVCWVLITPGTLTLILLWTIIFPSPVKYGLVTYPKWSYIIGWLMIAFCFMWIPLIAILELIITKGNILQRIRSSLKPAPDWGPFLKQHRGKRYAMQINPKKLQLHSRILTAMLVKSRN
ncbi:sodium- and chloride-dependent neutral and basic amino acid transporter B(0+)-like [Rhinoraja longicauda]